MTEDVFNGTTPPEVDDTINHFEVLVGEGKKYVDQNALAKAAVHKDQFIEQLQRENAEMRETIQKRSNEEEFLSKLEKIAQPKSPEPQNPPVERRDAPAQSALSESDIERIIEEREAKKTRDANLKTALSKLQEVYGDNYKSRVQSQAQQLGVGTDFLTDVAAKNPQAFFRLLGLEQPRVRSEDIFSAPPKTQVNSTTAPSVSNRKDYNYYKRMRDEKGDGWYFSQQVQQEIWRAAQEAEKNGVPFLPE